jgi:hypothetical protein
LLAALELISATCQGVREILIASPPTILEAIWPSRDVDESLESAEAFGVIKRLAKRKIAKTLLTNRCIFKTLQADSPEVNEN